MDKSKEFWIKFVQKSEEEELINSSEETDHGMIQGKYKRLAIFKDEKEIWRVGLRLREHTPFTYNGKPPAFIPRKSRLALLLMQQAHNRKHSGIDETVAQFRMAGYWTVKAAKLAKTVRSKCITCRILDKRPITQQMGGIPKGQLTNPVA